MRRQHEWTGHDMVILKTYFGKEDINITARRIGVSVWALKSKAQLYGMSYSREQAKWRRDILNSEGCPHCNKCDHLSFDGTWCYKLHKYASQFDRACDYFKKKPHKE